MILSQEDIVRTLLALLEAEWAQAAPAATGKRVEALHVFGHFEGFNLCPVERLSIK